MIQFRTSAATAKIAILKWHDRPTEWTSYRDARTLQGERHKMRWHSNPKFTSSTLEPIVGEVWTTSFMSSWYNIVVLPALSNPTTMILCSSSLNKLQIFENSNPIITKELVTVITWNKSVCECLETLLGDFHNYESFYGQSFQFVHHSQLCFCFFNRRF